MLYRSELTGILLAAGSSHRYSGGEKSKLNEKLGAVSVLETSVIALAGFCGKILLALPPDDLLNSSQRSALIRRAEEHKLALQILAGGKTRKDSVRNALGFVEADFLLIHDAARPCVHSGDLEALLTALDRNQTAAILATPVSDTLKRVNSDGFIETTISRKSLWAAQTPQAFSSDLYRETWNLYDQLDQDLELTDDASLFELFDLPVAVVRSSHPNPKITYAQDLELLRALKASSAS